MVEISEIKDEDSLKAWLNDQPRAFSTAIAARCALRVLPVFWDWSLTEAARKRDVTALPVLRPNLIAAVASKSPTAAIKTAAAFHAPSYAANAAAARAAFRAASYAASYADAAAAAARAADSAARAAGYAHAVVWENIRWDCADLEAGQSLLQTPLWRDENPLADLWRDIRPKILSAENWQPGDWRFWVGWYDQMLDPATNPPNWELLEQVATKIEPEVWDAGSADVANEIDRLRTKAGSEDAQGENATVSQADLYQLAETTAAAETRLAKLTVALRTAEEQLSALQAQTQAEVEQQAQASDARLAELAEAAKNAEDKALAWLPGVEQLFNDKIAAAEAALEARDVFAKPSKLWRAKEQAHRRAQTLSYRRFIGGLGLMAITLVAVLCLIWGHSDAVTAALMPSWCDPKEWGEAATPPAGCGGFSLKGMLVSASVLTMFTLLLWFTRLNMKEYLAERHLALDARERRAFSDAYVALLASGDGAKEEVKDQRAIVYGALFRPTSDGIVKEEGGLDPSIAAALSKLLSRG